MNENENTNTNESKEPGFFAGIAGDDGVQRAVAGVAVAVIVAGVKRAIFGA